MKKIYKKNYIAKVVFKLDFFENVSIANIEKSIKDITSFFPIQEQKEGETGFLEFNFNSGEVNKSTQKTTSWVFLNTEKTKKLEINSKYLLLEYSAGVYTDSTELLSIVQDLITPFLMHNEIKTINRLGLRYINEIPDFNEDDSNQLNWSKYINSNLISNINFVTQNNKRLARLMTQMVLKEELGDVIFNFGIWNKDYPNEIITKSFILDLDCFTKLGVDSSDLILYTESYNNYVRDVFEKSITKTLKDKMDE